jgi:hypothetical protein
MQFSAFRHVFSHALFCPRTWFATNFNSMEQRIFETTSNKKDAAKTRRILFWSRQQNLSPYLFETVTGYNLRGMPVKVVRQLTAEPDTVAFQINFVRHVPSDRLPGRVKKQNARVAEQLDTVSPGSMQYKKYACVVPCLAGPLSIRIPRLANFLRNYLKKKFHPPLDPHLSPILPR